MNSSFPPDIPCFFADAEAGMKNALFVLYGVCYEKTVSFRTGTKLGPRSVRQASWNFESYNPFTNVDLKDMPLHDYGNLSDIDQLPPEKMIETVKTFTKNILNNGKTPIVIGGEHSISSGVIQAFPDHTGVLVFDAHADYRNSYDQSTYNHACTVRRIADHVGEENIILIGMRSAGKEEYQQLKKSGIKVITSYDIIDHGIGNYLHDIKNRFDRKNIYLSIDIDAIDPCYAPGVGTPEPLGLQPIHILNCIDAISEHIIGFDLMEVNPQYDHGQTAFLAAKIIRHTLERLVSSIKK